MRTVFTLNGKLVSRYKTRKALFTHIRTPGPWKIPQAKRPKK